MDELVDDPATTDLLAQAAARLDHVLADLDRLVSIESPSADVDACRECLDAVADLAMRHTGRPAGVRPSQGRHNLWWGPDDPRVLLLCHADTVWPSGTLARWPFTVDGDVATGPGAFDMKAGIVLGLHALSLAGVPDGVAMLVTDDEEIGSGASRAAIEAAARSVDAVLVLEGGIGEAVKIGRKGVSVYHLDVAGRAAHAGLEPERGANALTALAELVTAVTDLADLSIGTTVTPTTGTAGTTINVVPAIASLGVDVRALTPEEQQRVDDGMHRLRTTVPGTEVTVRGGINRPPLEQDVTRGLYRRAFAVAESIGLGPLDATTVGGGSDGNFTGALGIPTLDGLGAVGAGAHAEGEHVVVSQLPRRLALLAGLLTDLTTGS